MNKLIFLLLPLFLFAANDKEEITRILNQWPDDFNAERLEPVCALFAPDAIASYPKSADRDYAALCRNFSGIFAKPDLKYTYDKPEIKEILINGDLAVVRLIWTLKVTKHDILIEKVVENGLDVFKKQPDGSWKIAISYAYPIE